MKTLLAPRLSPHATIEKTANGWRLQIPAGEAGQYRLAQLDDYDSLSRSNFAYKERGSLSLRCRVSSASLPGTWGFGFWNDPFAFSLGFQGTAQRLPALPNAVWFFNASPENHLAFQDQLPGHGFLAQTFRSPPIPAGLLLPGLLGAPLMLSKRFSKFLRRLSGSIIAQDGVALPVDTTLWHTYHINWNSRSVEFSVDDKMVFETRTCPRGALGTVIWIDNQVAAWTPEGKIGMGTLPAALPGWLELENLEIRA